MKKEIILAVLCGLVGAVSAAETLLAGWESTNLPDPTIENGVSGDRNASSGWTSSSGCNDATFGTLASPAASTDGAGYESSASSSYIEFELKNSGWRPISLSSFHFDVARRGASAPTHWKLEVRPGSVISAGELQQGPLNITFGGDFQDVDVNLSGWVDAELEEAGSAIFRISFLGGSGGNLVIDNVGIVGDLLAGHATDIHYIYTVPPNPTASLDIDTGIRTPINPMHLSLNVGAQEYYGFNEAADKARFRRFNPPSTRWPIGVWANWYDWENDGHRIYDDYDTSFRSAIEGSQGKRYGFPGLHALHDELNFDVLFSWNLLYDSPGKGVRRLNDRWEKGFDFNWIELGNEIFWKDQRSNSTATERLYRDVAKAHAAALKAEDPFIQLAVPAQFRDTDGTGWNDPMANDQSFFDAITVHKYIRDDDTSTGQDDALKAGKTLLGIAEDMAALFPGKPQWYTEWGVCSGENAISVIGQTDAFLTFFNHQDVFAMNQYHQVNGVGHMFITEDDKKTSWGAGYDVVRDVFLDSEMFKSILTATAVTEDFDVVQAEAVTRDGKLTVFAVNKTPDTVPFTFSLDGAAYTGTADHRAFAFENMTDFPEFEIEEDPLTVVALNTSMIMLPPFSLNVIDGLNINEEKASEILIEAESAEGQAMFSPFETQLELGGHTYMVATNGAATVNYNSVVAEKGGIASYTFELEQAGSVSLEVLGKFETTSGDGFWFRLDGGPWEKWDGLAGGGWKCVMLEHEKTLTAGIHSFEIARRDALTKLDRFRVSSKNSLIIDPRVTRIVEGGITRIEAEDYDEGGEGVGYHDRTPGNNGGVYRDDNVDIQACSDVDGGHQVSWVASGEWLQYPIHIEKAGMYALTIRAARQTTGNSSFRVLVDNRNATGTLQIPSTGSWNSWTNVITEVELEEGEQLVRVKLTGGNVNLNWIELKPLVVPDPWTGRDIGAVAIKGISAYGADSFTVKSSGSDIWNAADEFHFVCRPVDGDCEIIARVAHLENTNPWAKAGVMIRETLDADSANMAVLLTPENGVTAQARTTAGDITSSQKATDIVAPGWLKISRVGNTFSCYRSDDGSHWIAVGSARTIDMASSVYIGLAATSHDDGNLGTSVFEQVTTAITLKADAGADQVVPDEDLDGFAVVTLDGSASIEGNDPSTSYVWTEGAVEVAQGETANCVLEFGVHTLTLTVSDGMSTASDEVVISVEPSAPGMGPVAIIAGWESWTSADSPATVENGTAGMAVKTGWNMEFRAGSSDGTFGTMAGADPTVGIDGTYHYTGTRYPDMTSASIDFIITDVSGEDTELSGFYFDSVCRGASPAWGLEVVSGAISTGFVSSGTVDNSRAVNTLSDYSVDLSSLADATLDAGGSATFRLSFASGMANHLELDNVGLSGARMQSGAGGYPDSNANGLLDYWEQYYFGGLGVDPDGDADFDALSNYAEFVAGTNPTNALSGFAIKEAIVEPTGVTLTWDSVNGRTYNVLQTADLLSNSSTSSPRGAWISVTNGLSGIGGELSVTDLTAPSTNRFYKIQVIRP